MQSCLWRGLHGSFASRRMTNRKTKTGGGQLRRLPLIVNRRASPGWTAEGGCPHRLNASLRGFAGSFDFQSLVASDVYLDLLGLGFSLLRQSDLQNALVVVRRDFLGVHGCGQSEGAGEAAILALHTAIVLFLLFVLDLALAVNREDVVLNADIDIFLIDSRNFDLQSNLVLVFVDVDGRGKAGCGKGLVAATFAVGLAEQAVHAVLQGGKLAERLPTGKYGHG